MFVVSITAEWIDLRCSNFVYELMVAMGPGNKFFVKIAHAHKVAFIEKYVFQILQKIGSNDFD